MCKKIKDILFPTNVLGKNIVSKSFKLQVDEEQGFVNVQVFGEGERVEMSFTQIANHMHGRFQERIPTRFVSQKEGDIIEIDEDILVGIHRGSYYAIGATDGDAPEHNVIYLKCTNVTSLTVNGEQII